jgi:sodium/bile acid cotransporter 2
MGLGSWEAITGNVLLFGLVLGLASTVRLESFRASLYSRGLVIGCFAQFVFLPLLGFAVASILFANEPELGIPLIITTSSPGGSYSNWWTSLFNGDLSLSVAMTTVSSLLSIGLLPLNLFIYIKGAYPHDDSVKMRWAGLFVSIGVVIFGIVSGLFIGARFQKVRTISNIVGNICGILLVLLGFFFSSSSSTPIWAQDFSFYIGLIIPCVLGLLLSMLFALYAKLEMPQVLAVAIEVCYQNTAIALAVILSSFDDPTCAAGSSCDVVGRAAGVPAFYQIVQLFSLGILCMYAHRRGWTYAPKEVSLFVAITRSYQPDNGAGAEGANDVENTSPCEMTEFAHENAENANDTEQ